MNLSALFIQCRSGFVIPTETFQGLNRLNVSDGLANPVTLSFIVPTLRRGNAGVDVPASRNLCEANVFGGEPVFRNAGVLRTEFPRRSAHRYTHLDVGRNKPVRALCAGQAFPAFRYSEVPETPTLAVAGRAYSGLHPVLNRLVYKDERRSVGTMYIVGFFVLFVSFVDKKQ
jgi:hypothetical protein